MDDDLIRRVTVIRRDGEVSEARTVHRESRKRAKVSVLTLPFARLARHLAKAQVIYGQELLRRHDRANRRRRDGWIVEGPSIILGAGRSAYNEARKGIPFRILPKA
jgi:hypothetical protein